MPWHVAESSECPSSRPWAVIKDADGSVEGCHATKKDAQDHMAALYANEGDSTVHPANRIASDITQRTDAYYLPRLEAAYRDAILQVARAAASRLTRQGATVLASAEWAMPTIDEVAPLWEVEGALRDAGVDLRWDAYRRAVEEMSTRLGRRTEASRDDFARLDGVETRIADGVREQIRDQIYTAWYDGATLDEAKRRLVASFTPAQTGFALRAVTRAAAAARTAMTASQTSGNMAGARASGVGMKTWITAPGAPHPRHDTYEGLDGQTVPIDRAFAVGGYPAMHPSDPQLPPEEAINCRCDMLFGDDAGGADTGHAHPFALDLAAGLVDVIVAESSRAVEQTVTASGEAATLASVPDAITAGAVGSTSLPLGDQDEAWDAAAAKRAMDGAADYKRYHFWQMPDSDPDLIGSYKLPFGSGGRAVWRGVTAAAAALQGARGGVQGVDADAVKPKIEAYYRKARQKYNDDSIEVPWAGASAEVEHMTSDDLIDRTLTEVRERVALAQQDMMEGGILATGRGWRADPLYFEGLMTRDGRVLDPPNPDKGLRGGYWTDTPKTLMAQFQSPESGGHALAVVAGTMPGTRIVRDGTKVTAEGDFNQDEHGKQAAEYVANQSLTGISVDLAPQRWQIEMDPSDEEGWLFFTSDEPEPADEGPLVIEGRVDEMVIRFTDYEVIGGTLVSTPAFGEAQVAMAADAQGRMHRIAKPRVGEVLVQMRTTEKGWPVPVRVTVGGLIASADTALHVPPVDSVEELSVLVDALDRAKLAGFLTPAEAGRMFGQAMRRRR